MRKILILTVVMLALSPISASADDHRCKGLLSRLFDIDTGLSCEQRQAMMGAGMAMQTPPSAHPARTAPAIPPLPAGYALDAPSTVTVVPAAGLPRTYQVIPHGGGALVVGPGY